MMRTWRGPFIYGAIAPFAVFYPGIFWLLAVSLLPAVSGVKAACLPAPAGLVGWWPGDGNANNVLGTNNGTLQAGATASGPGVVGTAFNFDGTNNYVSVPESAILKPPNLTLEAWVRFTGLDSSGTAAPVGVQYIVFKQNSRSGDFEGFSLVKERVSGSDHFTFQVTSAAGVGVDVTSTTLISTGVWYHVAAVRGSNFIQLFVNGQLERQTNVAFAQDYGTLPLYFGSTGQSFWDRKFRGTLDEVSLFNRALATNEIAAIYAAGADGKCKGAGIAVSPQSQSVIAGSNAVFSVTATGFGALSYQWRFNGTNLSGATGTNLNLTAVQPANAGNYNVVVTNTLGAATSAIAVLTVLIPPAITTQPQSRTNIAGTDAAFAVTATGTAPLNYQWRFNSTNLPGETTANYMRPNVQPADAGSYTVIVTNAAGAVTSTVASLVVKSPPVLPVQANRTVPELTTLTVTNTAGDNDTPASGLFYALTVAPGNATIATNGVITWTPTEAQGPGTNVLTTVVTDTDGLSATNSFTVIVTELNDAPVLPGQTNRTVAELTLLTVVNTATDGDSPANGLSYSLLASPSGATINPNNGVISWTPTEAQGPSVNNVFTTRVVDDGIPALSATNTFLVTVTEVNDAPVLPGQTNRTVAELTLLTVVNTATDSDQPANGLSYSLLASPSGATINPNNGVISWTPTEAQGPSVNNVFTTRVVDDGVPALGATNTFLVTVTEVNDAPVLPGQTNRTVAELTLLTVVNTATDGDSPTNNLTYSLLASPGGATINPNNGVISWTPTEAQGPSVNNVFTTRVVDDGVPALSATNSFLVTVTEVNEAPVANNESYSLGRNEVLSVAAPGVLANDTDQDMPANTLTAVLVSGPANGSLILTNNGGFRYTPANNYTGPDSFTYRANDGLDDSGVATVSLTVSASSSLPFIDDFTRGSDPGPLAPWVSNSGNWTVTGGVLNGGPNAPSSGYGLAYVSNNWTDFALSGRVRFEEGAFGGGLGGRLDSVTGVRYAAWVYPEGSPGGANALRLVKFTGWTDFTQLGPTVDLAGVGTNWHDTKIAFHGSQIAVYFDTNLVLSVADESPYPAGGISAGLWTDVTPHTLFVDDVRADPLAADDHYTAGQDAPLPVAPPGVLGNDTAVYDDGLTASLESGPTHGNLVLTTNGGFTYTPTNGYLGPDSFTYALADGAVNLGSATVTLTVNPMNHAPVLATVTNRTMAETASLTVTNAAGDADASDTLTYSLLVAPAGANINPNTGVITWAPTEAQGPGVNTFTTRVVDNGGPPLSATNSFLVTVTEVNQAPVLPAVTNRTVTQGALLTVINAATDADLPANALTYQLLNPPAGATIASDGVITWTPGVAQAPSTNSLTTVVTDNGSPPLSATNGFTVVVTANSGVPVITAHPQSRTNAAGTPASFNVTATGTATLQYQWRFNGTNIGGATATNLMLTSVQITNAGDYTVVVTNAIGGATSQVAKLAVFVPGILPDPNLSNAVYLALGKTNNTLTTLDLASLTNLYADFRNITNLTGLNLATNLTRLTLAGNAISDLTPLAGLRRLVTLELDDRNGLAITSLTPLASLSNLTTLMLGGLPLYDLTALAGLTNLTSLALPRCALTDLSAVTSLRRLTTLALGENQFADLTPLTGLTNLTQLDLRQNYPTNYALLGGLTNLTRLCCGWNYSVSNVNFLLPLTRLTWLDIGYAEVRDLTPLAQLTNLTYLVLNGNPATNYSVLANLTGLVNLELRGNLMTNATFLTNFTRLAYADLYRSVTNLPPLLGLTNLSSIVLAGVPNLSPLTGLNLTNLWLANNGLSNAAFFTAFPRLRHLSLDDNAIANPLPLLALANLTGLGLSRNPGLNPTDLAGFTNLTRLVLDGYAISNLSFLSNLTRLEALSLRNSRVTELSGLAGLTNLAACYTERSRLTNPAALLNLPRLRFAGLTGNGLDLSPGSAALTTINELQGWGAATPGRGAQVASLPQNQSPVLSLATNWIIPMNESSTIGFSLWDDATAVSQLVLTTNSANPALIPNGNVTLVGTNADRTLTVTPLAGQSGTTTITLIATDEAGASVERMVSVQVVVPTPLTNLCPNLDANVVSALSLASGTPAADLTLVDLLRVEFLSVNDANLTDACLWSLTTNLISLNLVSNTLAGLNFLTNLPRLTSLSLNHNTATDLSVLAGFTNLTALNLGGNAISDLAFLQDFTSLRQLSLNDNLITVLAPVTGLTNLSQLSLYGNRLTQINPLTNLPQLAFADLRLNLLSLSNGSPARAVITLLTNGGTTVLTTPQWGPPRIDIRTNWVINANATSTAPFTITNEVNAGNMLQFGVVVANPSLVTDAATTLDPGDLGTLTLTSAANQAIGTTLVTLTATNEVGLGTSVGIVVTVTMFVPVNGLLLNQTNLTWTSGGDVPWFGQTLVTHDGVSAAQSGVIGDFGMSELATTVVGPGLLTYWHKISSETNFDYLELYFNDELQPNRISGEVNWQPQTLMVPAGEQVLRWRYTKDKDSSFETDAAWVDEVTYVQLSWLELTRGLSNSFPMQLTLHVTPGELYEVLHSTNLVNWLTYASLVATNSEMLLLDTNAPAPRRFYRLRGLGSPPP